MRVIFNLTQHTLTDGQRADGAEELPSDARQVVRELLTFAGIPSKEEISQRAKELAQIAVECCAFHTAYMGGDYHAMIGGAPYLMGSLEQALRDCGIKPVYSFSERRSVEAHGPDGTVTKTNEFQHVGWIFV